MNIIKAIHKSLTDAQSAQAAGSVNQAEALREKATSHVRNHSEDISTDDLKEMRENDLHEPISGIVDTIIKERSMRVIIRHSPNVVIGDFIL